MVGMDPAWASRDCEDLEVNLHSESGIDTDVREPDRFFEVRVEQVFDREQEVHVIVNLPRRSDVDLRVVVERPVAGREREIRRVAHE